MIDIVTSCIGSITSLLSHELYSYVCYGILVFGLFCGLISFLKGGVIDV